MSQQIHHLIFITFLSALLFACGGGGGDDGGGETGPVSVAGEWDITETINDQACGGNGDTDSYSITVIQNGSDITVTAPNGTFNGSLSGNTLSWTGQYRDDIGGWVSITSMSLNVSDNSFSGTASWDWRESQNGPVVCSGSNEITGSKIPVTNPPAAPINLNATPTSESTISLSWTNSAEDQVGFNIYRSLSDSGNYVSIAGPHVGTTSYADSNLEPDTTYYYYVSAYNDAGNADSSIVFAMTPSPSVSAPGTPSGLRATRDSTTSLTLNWTDVASETTYKIQRSNSQFSGFTQIGTTAANTTHFVETGLTEDATYYYRVIAANSTGDSMPSATLSVIMGATEAIPGPPLGLSATALSSTSIRLSWRVSNASLYITNGYYIERRRTIVEPYVRLPANVSTNSTSYTDNNLSPDSRYYYRIQAFNATGSSGYSLEANATTEAAPAVSRTTTLYATNDNLIMRSTTNPSVANTYYNQTSNAVGCNWVVTYYGDINSLCSASLIYFDTSSVAGKTIISATLKLSVDVPPATLTTYWVEAIYSQWYFNVTWNDEPLPYNNSVVSFNSRYGVQPLLVNVTPIMENWASGFWNNRGFMLSSGSYTNPNGNSAALATTTFCSLEYCGGGQDVYPQLIVEYIP